LSRAPKDGPVRHGSVPPRRAPVGLDFPRLVNHDEAIRRATLCGDEGKSTEIQGLEDAS
jgi:hypothetical protein